MKKDYAIFTIVRNENIFLKIWYEYYNQFFDSSDIYVIDDSTIDGSTDFLSDSQIHKIYNEYAHSHRYLLDNVHLFRDVLLEKYNYVIFAEVDEIIWHKNYKLNDYLKYLENNGIQFATCVGYEIFHNPQLELPIDLENKIISQRMYWFRHYLYDKLLIFNKKIYWILGFHNVIDLNKDDFKDEDLYLIHLHRFDYNKHKERKLFFAKNYKNNDSPSLGYQNKLKTEDQIDEFYFSPANTNSEHMGNIELIPNFIKISNPF